MVIDDLPLDARALERSAPAASDAVAFAGGLGIAVGVLLLSIEFYTKGHGRWPGIALFSALIAVGYLALGLLPSETHPAAVTMIVAGVPGAVGWWLLPHAHRFADADRLFHRTFLEVETSFLSLLCNDAQERRHGDNRGWVSALDHFKHEGR